jgi:hypothetical protein
MIVSINLNRKQLVFGIFLIPWGRVLGKLRVNLLLKIFPIFYRAEGSFVCLEEPSTDSTLTHINPVHTIPLHFFKIHLNTTFLSNASVFQMVSFLWIPLPKFCRHFSSPVHATCPTHLILLDFTTLIILCEEYKL